MLSPEKSADPEEPASQSLTQGTIFRFYLPLAVSWIFMSIETPIAAAILSRLTHAEVNTAANLIMGAIALWIESPVIDLLATSTTLAKSRFNYLVLRRFALWMMAWVTVAHTVVAATPLYWPIVGGLLHQDARVVQALHIPLIIMIPWSGFIGWRRYLQGIMIRHGDTKVIGIGTTVRVATMAGVGFGLYFFAPLPGLVIVATALVSSVIAESVFIHFASKPTLRREFDGPETSSDEGLTMAKLAWFHLPLTASTMVTLLALPFTGVALALTSQPILAPAAWLVTLALLSPLRTITYALTEPTIALYKDKASLRQLRRFAFYIGSFATGTVWLAALTGFDIWFFRRALSYNAEVAWVAHVGLIAGSLTPLINSQTTHLRGALTAHHETFARLLSIFVGVSVLGAMLAVGVALGWPGPILAGSALSVSMLSEYGALLGCWRGLRRSGRLSEPSAA